MPAFRYTAVKTSGETINGVLTAQTMDEVEEWLEQRNFTPIEIVPGVEEGKKGSGLVERINQRLARVTLEDKILFCRQVTTLFGAGIPVIRIFDTLGSQLKNPRLKAVVQQVKSDVEAGENLSDAFSKHRNIFDDLFINLIRVGEESGTLDRSFDYLATLYENEKDVRERIRAATRYPKIV